MHYNKYRLTTCAYKNAQHKKHRLLELQTVLNKISTDKNIQCNFVTENYIKQLYDSINIEIEACDKVPEFENEEVYSYHQMIFKKVYDDTINPEECCKYCDIKFPCKTWNSEIGCLKKKDTKISEYEKEHLCINFDGVFKKLTPEEEKKYKIN